MRVFPLEGAASRLPTRSSPEEEYTELRRKLLVVAAASCLLALALPATVLAADVSESLTVNGAISVTGVPTSLGYGNVDPGGTSALQTIGVTVTSNGSWAAQMSGSDFTGAGSMPASVREGQLACGGTAVCNESAGFHAFGAGGDFGDAGAEALGTAGSGTLTLDLRVKPPASQAAGAYSGTLTIVVSPS